MRLRKIGMMVAVAVMSLVVSAAPVWADGDCEKICPAKCKDDSGQEVKCDGIQTNLFSNTTGRNGAKCYCPKDPSRGSAIGEILTIVVNIFSALVLVLGVVGLSIAGVQYLTARDNDGQVAKAKNRILQVVIGLAAYACLWAFLNWLMPGGLFN